MNQKTTTKRAETKQSHRKNKTVSKKNTNNRRNKNDQQEKPEKVPKIAPGVIRIVPLGGVEEIGKNMTAIEFGNDIIVIDAGLQFPDDDSPGIDYILPDSAYLEERKHKIRGLVVTHGHLDHTGGIPYILPKIGNPPIYTSLLTAVMVKKRQEEFPHLPKPDIKVVDKDESLKLGNMRLRFFGSTHTIPDSLGVVIETPFGNIIFTGDVKIENKKGVPEKFEKETYEKLGREKNLLLIADSTNVEKPGFSLPENEVQENLKKIVADIPGRIIFSTFASLFDRIIFLVKTAESLNKKVVVEGRSMKNNVEIAKELGLLKIKRDTIISADQMDNYPDNKIVVLATGAQGNALAALMRIANQDHKTVKIKPGDTVLLSSSVVPGNEKSVQKLKDNLSRQGANIVHHGVADVHSSGHSYQDEVKWIHKKIKPKFFIPVHGHHFMLRVHAKIAEELKMPKENIVIPDNGMVIEITDKGKKIASRPETASNKIMMVDGLGTGNVQEIVIRDRQMLAQDGMFIIVATIDINTGKVPRSPDIISRGFIYLKESQELLKNTRHLIKRVTEETASNMHPINFDYLKNTVREEVGKYLFQKTHKRPIILPVLIEV